MYTLFIDESGKADLAVFKKNFPMFVMGGIIVEQNKRDWMKCTSEFIKHKYWRDKSILFHASQGTGLQSGEYEKFITDLGHFIEGVDFSVVTNTINKEKYIESDPGLNYAVEEYRKSKSHKNIILGRQKALIKKSSYNLLTMFIYFLQEKEANGRVVIEATGSSQDRFVFDAYEDLLHNGHVELGLTIKQTRKLLTSISFVTKNNKDIELQMSDMLVYYSNLESCQIDGLRKSNTDRVKELLGLLHNKSFRYKETSDPLEEAKDSMRREI